MSQVVSFADYLPAARYDGNPWTGITIEEAPTSTGPWTLIDTQTFAVPDDDPAHPQERSFTTDQASDTFGLWYRITFTDTNGDVSLPTAPIQNPTVAVAAYATTNELFRILKVREPSDDQTLAAQSDLNTATLEINAEIDLADDAHPLDANQLELCRGVCLDRAADLWRHRESVPGVLGVLDETLTAAPGRYSWERYAQRLAPVKRSWGIA